MVSLATLDRTAFFAQWAAAQEAGRIDLFMFLPFVSECRLHLRKEFAAWQEYLVSSSAVRLILFLSYAMQLFRSFLNILLLALLLLTIIIMIKIPYYHRRPM